MEMQTIGQVSKKYGISIQTLRYYEEIELIKSTRNGDNAYRFYDEAAIKKIHSIIFLRKLRISVKQIKEILDNQNAAATVEILERNISELDEEITSLSTIKSILTRFAKELRAKADMVLQLDVLNDTLSISIVDSLSFSKNYINNSIKENVTMENLNKANETLSKLKDSDVRIIYVPPMTVAALHGLGGEIGKPKAPHEIEEFERETGLFKIKPDTRKMIAGNYSKEDFKALIAFDSREDFKENVRVKECEIWLTILDDMEVPAPLTKKTFEGGLYAVRNGYFEDMRFLVEWVNTSERYEAAYERPFLQEFLNYYYHVYMQGLLKTEDLQNEYLLPIKKIAE